MKKNIRKQNGFSLIEVMVGMVISLIVITTMLMLFKSQTKISYGKDGLVQTSKAYAQTTSALTIVGLKIQSAGFGFTPTLNTDVQLYSNALMTNGKITSGTKLTIGSTSATGNLVVWVENNKANGVDNYQCKGFFSDQKTGALNYISQINCQTINLGSTWIINQIINNNTNGWSIYFEMLTQASCSPFGLLSTSGVSNSGLTFKLNSNLNGTNNVQGYCLLNY